MKSAGTKYNEAITRNMASFINQFSKANLETLIELSKISLEQLKTRIGIKKTDAGFDTKLSGFLTEAQGKVEAQEKKKKAEKPKAKPGKDLEGQVQASA